jgi:hypothetical protein
MQTTFAPQAVQQELQAIVDGIKARPRAKQAAAAAPRAPIPEQPVADKVARLQAALTYARTGFDPAYQQCDDYTEWTKQAAKAANIAYCTRELASLGVAS